jgi:pyruvate dehydrogenase E1 component alpha subunit
MSDPGITYRDRDEVAGMRAARDCIEQTKGRLIDAGWATAEELKEEEKAIRAQVTKEVEEASRGSLPRPEILYEDIYYQEKPPFIRHATFEASVRFA